VKVASVEADLVAALATVTDLPDQVVWAVDIVGAPSALILALLARAGSPVCYASGRVVNTVSAAYTGEVVMTSRSRLIIRTRSAIRSLRCAVNKASSWVRSATVVKTSNCRASKWRR
jgi:hypothetical protein